jgi:hypothetical protein
MTNQETINRLSEDLEHETICYGNERNWEKRKRHGEVIQILKSWLDTAIRTQQVA